MVIPRPTGGALFVLLLACFCLPGLCVQVQPPRKGKPPPESQPPPETSDKAEKEEEVKKESVKLSPPGMEGRKKAYIAVLVYFGFQFADKALDQYLERLGYNAPSSLAAAAVACVEEDESMAAMLKKHYSQLVAAADNLKGDRRTRHRMLRKAASLFRKSRKTVQEEDVRINSGLVDCVAGQYAPYPDQELLFGSIKTWLNFVLTMGEGYLVPLLVSITKRTPWDTLKKSEQLLCTQHCTSMKTTQEELYASSRVEIEKFNEHLCVTPLPSSPEVLLDDNILGRLKEIEKTLKTHSEDNFKWYCIEALGINSVGSTDMLITDHVQEELEWIRDQALEMTKTADSLLTTKIALDEESLLPVSASVERDFVCGKYKTTADFASVPNHEQALLTKWRCSEFLKTHGASSEIVEKCKGVEIAYQTTTSTPVLGDEVKRVSMKEYITNAKSFMKTRNKGNLVVFKDPSIDLKYNLDYCEMRAPK